MVKLYECFERKSSNYEITFFLIIICDYYMVSLGRPYLFKFFKGCLPQILLGLFLNTLTHLLITTVRSSRPEGCARPATLLKKILWHRCFPVS